MDIELQAKMIQSCVAVVAEVSVVLLMPPSAAALSCISFGYFIVVGLYLISASGGFYNPFNGIVALSALQFGPSECSTEVIYF